MTGRALILAGGGIRVAWQTGVVMALDEAGLTFDHGDATSGGIFTLGMLLSGLSPDEMGERWRRLSVGRFISLLPLSTYLRSPTNWPAVAGSSGIRRHVLPALGIDPIRVNRSSRMTGSFNVADFRSKECVAIPHTEVDEDLMIAGVSLAGLMPAVRRRGRTWTDAVWIKDANLKDAVDKGCSELWIAWCIGNTPRWGTGALEQYVHMIEMSAIGGLSSELEWIRDRNEHRGEQGDLEPVVLHIIKPKLPLPLDPEFVTGRIDAETLIAMGYRDASQYLQRRTTTGVPIHDATARHAATATVERPLGGRITFRATGALNPGGTAQCTVVVEAESFADIVHSHRTTAVGAFQHPQAGWRPFRAATVELSGWGRHRCLSVTAELSIDGRPHQLNIEMPIPPGKLFTGWSQRWTLTTSAGMPVAVGAAQMSAVQAIRTITSFEPTGAHNLGDRLRAIRSLRRIVKHGGPRPTTERLPC